MMRIGRGDDDFGRYASHSLQAEAQAQTDTTDPEAVAAVSAETNTSAEAEGNPLALLPPPEKMPAFAPLPPETAERPASNEAFAALPQSRFELVSREVDAGSTPAPAAPAPATAAAPAAAVAVAAATPPSGYVGEAAVDVAWLTSRETTLVAVRADYEAARARAQASAGSGPGWTPAVLVTDESGQVHSANNASLVFISDSSAPPAVTGYDESGSPISQQPAGHYLEFNEEAFAASYREQAGAPLQALAAQYGTDAATLFAKHPEIWRIATTDHALNAGPAPEGRAMGDAGQLGMLDLYVADPQIASLITAYGGSPAPATSAIALEQVRIYGQQRYDQLSRLGNAMQAVRDQYSSALSQVQNTGAGPGWLERERTITTSDESGAQTTRTLYVTDESGTALLDAAGQPQAQLEHVFDPDAFTAWYMQQGGLQHEAFASFYGASQTQFATDESGRSFASSISFANPNWTMYGVGGAMAHRELVSIDPNNPPDLNDDSAVGFDLEAGWATHNTNIEQDKDWLDTVMQVVIVAAVAYVSAGTLGPAAAGAMGVATTSVAGAVISAAVVGAATSAASGMLSGNLSLKGILQGALAGGLTAGLMNGLGSAVNSVAGPAGTIALRATVQGGVQALMGGNFKDGALAGLASGLSDLVSTNLEGSIAEAVKNGAMDATQATSARMFARVFGSAIRAAGNPDDPAHAFASAFVSDTLQQLGDKPVSSTAFDDDGNLMPGIVDAAASPEQQRLQLQAQLERQGFDPAQAQAMAGQYFAGTGAPVAPPVATAPAEAETPPAEAEPSQPPAEAAPPPPPTQITVQPGDSLYRIAEGLADPGASAAQINDLKNQLAAANPQLDDLNRLSPGQVLNLPTADTVVDAATLARLGQADAQYLAQQPPEDMQPAAATESAARNLEVERLVRLDILGQEAREDSVSDGELLLTGGPARNAARGGGFEMVRNGNWDAALNLGADPLGLLGELPGLQADLAKLNRMQAEQRIDGMRRAMVDAGVKNVPTGFAEAWVTGADGTTRIVKDYGATVNQLQGAYENHIRDQRLRETWGDDYQSVRLGKSRMSATDFEKKVLDIHLGATDRAYAAGVEAIAKGELPVKDGEYAKTLGNYIDKQVRDVLRGFARTEGISDNPMSKLWAINRQIKSEFLIGIPDSRLGFNLFADTTLARKNANTEQIIKWNEIRPGSNFMIIRPSQLGGPYVIPRDTIPRYTKPVGRGT